MKLKLLIILGISLFFITTSALASTSLWSDKAADIYQDEVTEYNIGDVITVIIEENADATQSANSSAGQKSSVDASAGTGMLDFITSFGMSYSDDETADGKTQRSGKIQADISTTVEKKYDNGNLGIVGTKRIKVNGEEQIIKLSGIIRPDDITEYYTISSKKIAEVDLEFEGKGIVGDKQKSGIIHRFLNWLF